MIAEEFWKSWLAFWLLAGPILLGFVNFAFNLYLSRRHLDTMMKALKNSRYIYIWGPGWRAQGWVGGIILITKIAGMVVMPRVYIRCGEVDPLDIKNFPPYLKRLLIIDMVMVVVAIVWMAIGFMMLKFK